MGILNFFKQNHIPEKIRINRLVDYHTHHIGRTSDGRQFFGYQTFVFPNRVQRSLAERREYVVLYLFDKAGNHLETKHWYAGTTTEIDAKKLFNKLSQMITDLGPVEYSDIEVKPFQSIIDGVAFGLIPNEEHRSMELQPSSTISFQAPWDGEYYT